MDTFYDSANTGLPLYQAVQNHDRRQLSASQQDATDGVAPPGWEHSITRMKKHGSISNPWALAWWMKRRGAEPAKHETDAVFEAALANELRLLHGMTLPTEYQAAAKGELWAQSLLLDPYAPPLIMDGRR